LSSIESQNHTSQDEIPFKVTDPERIPSPRYYDENFYNLECQRLWPRVWQMACRLELIPNVGDWVEYSNIGKSVIVIRTTQGVKAFHNACRHRGVRLTEASNGNCQHSGLTCPFHGWRWNMDGENTLVYGKHLFSDDLLQADDLALVPCRSEIFGGCVFINFDDSAPSYRECLGGLADRLEAHGLSNLRAEWWYATELPANWKVATEAFQEGYHVMRTHPQLQRADPSTYNSRYTQLNESSEGNLTTRQCIQRQLDHMEKLSTGMAGMLHEKELAIIRQLADVEVPETPQDGLMMWFGIVQDQISKQLQAQGEPVPDLNSVSVSDPIEAVEFLFPHFFLLPFFTSMSSYRIRPLGPEKCLFEIWSLTGFPEGKEPNPVMEPTFLPYDSKDFPPIPQQDFANIPIQQLGLKAQGFDFMRLSKNVEGMISNYQRIIDGYLSDVPADKIAKAINQLAGNFDGKIKELDL